jgi:NADPH:quinone reductase-like Zn-dependent oxidoreductase
MKAVRLLEYSGQLVFDDVPTPKIARDEILVKIKSTAVNHLDLVEASGTARQILPIDLLWIPGHEFSGVVEQIGSDVAACAPGNAVFGTTTGIIWPEEVGNSGRVRWLSGRPGEAPAYAGTDFIIARDGRIAAVYLFFDKLP